MSIEETFGNLFKPEVRSSGRKLVSQEKVSISSASDTSVHAYVRGSPPFRVTLTAEDVSSTAFTASCSCPVAKKDRFCKHMWATLLWAEEKNPDFLLGKIEINRISPHLEASGPTPKSTAREAAKQRANAYRKDQYQKQKTRVKEKKRAQKGAESAAPPSPYPEAVETSLAYFSTHGFPMPDGPSREILNEAKRKLSRIFHPDKGGSHEESVELNQHCEVILNFLR